MNTFRCPNCGFLNFAGAQSCKRCKTEFGQGVVDSVSNTVETNSSNDSGRVPINNFTDNFAPSTANQNTPPIPFGQTNQQYRQNQDSRQSNNQSFPPPNASPFGVAPPPYLNSSPKLKSGLAIASMVMGCVGFFMCGGLFGLLSLPGLIIGIVALTKANKKPFEYGGKGYAIAGIVTNGLLILMIPVISAIAIPNLLAARRAANEGSAISSMRTLINAESIFMKTSTVNRCGDLTDLLRAGLIDATLATGQKSGYKYVIAKNSNGSCEMFAAPLVTSGAGKTGTRSFYASTVEGQIRAADKDGAPADKNDPMLGMPNNSIEARRSF
jgi:hypothetical protein